MTLLVLLWNVLMLLWMLLAHGFGLILALLLGVWLGYKLARLSHLYQPYLYKEAWRDPLTGLLSRSAIASYSGGEDPDAVELPKSVILIDIDGLRELNRQAGLLHGDRALKLFAERAGLLVPETEQSQLYRWGGDEFLIVSMPDCDDETSGPTPIPKDLATSTDSLALARQLVSACRYELEISPSDLQPELAIRSWPLRISVGVARTEDVPFVVDGNQFDRTLEAADIALRAAKTAGGDRAFLWTKTGPVPLPR